MTSIGPAPAAATGADVPWASTASGALAGAIFGWVVWARQDHFNNWMILVGIGLFLFVRAIVLRILAARRGEGHVHPGAGHGPGSSPASAPEAVLAEGTSAPVAAAGAGSMEVSR